MYEIFGNADVNGSLVKKGGRKPEYPEKTPDNQVKKLVADWISLEGSLLWHVIQIDAPKLTSVKKDGEKLPWKRSLGPGNVK